MERVRTHMRQVTGFIHGTRLVTLSPGPAKNHRSNHYNANRRHSHIKQGPQRAGSICSTIQGSVYKPSATWCMSHLSTGIFHEVCSRATMVATFKRDTSPVPIVLFASLFFYFVGRWRGFFRGRYQEITRPSSRQFPRWVAAMDSTLYQAAPQQETIPTFVNYALQRLWKLFQKNSRQLTQEQLQPLLDEVNKPTWVQYVRLVRYVVGDNAPVIREWQPVPARSLAEFQCTCRLFYASASQLEFQVGMHVTELLPALNWLWLFSKKPPSHQRHPSPIIMVPVTLSNLQLDARLWSAFTLVPFAPYVSSWRYAVMETPHVEFDMTIGRHLGFLPPRITSVPVLRQLFFNILAREIPRDFFFPAYNTVDFTPKNFQEKRCEFSNMTREQIGQLLEEDVKAWFLQQWNMYQALNLNQTNGLTLDELTCGLIDWGYSTRDAAACFAQMDVQRKGSISFPEFCKLWPNATAYEVPMEYEGVLYVRIHRADGLLSKRVMFGSSDPVIHVRVASERVTCPCRRGSESDVYPIGNETLEINCQSIVNQMLEVSIQDQPVLGFARKGRILGQLSVPLKSLLHDAKQIGTVLLHPQGNITMELIYGSFADRWQVE